MSVNAEKLVVDPQTEDPNVIVAEWVHALSSATETRDEAALRHVLHSNGTWRDLLAFRWDFTSAVGIQEVVSLVLGADMRQCAITHRTDAGAIFETDTRTTVIGFFAITTGHGPGNGFVRLMRQGEGSWVAVNVLTQLEEVAGFPEHVYSRRPRGKNHRVVPDRLPWQLERDREIEFLDSEPQVLILGAGQCGLSTAARLKALGISALIIEQNDRVGDNWRHRYPWLALHMPSVADHLPYMEYSGRWPMFPPKDKFADHLEYYAKASELNVWTGSRAISAEHDASASIWTVVVQRKNGLTRTLHPRHLVVATGLNGLPNIPTFPRQDEFRGQIIHSGSFAGGGPFKGRDAVVVGSGVSAHDTVQDLHEHGANVTMLQRSPTYVINIDTFVDVLYSIFLEPRAFSLDDTDMIASSLPIALMPEAMAGPTAIAAERDKETIEALEKVGFRTTLGPRGGGTFDLHLLGRDGYYLNTGTSELIMSKRVAVKSGVEIDHFTTSGVALTDGTTLEASVVVMATGYRKPRAGITSLLGSALDKVPSVYEVGDDRELTGVWRRTGQDGLWFAAGIISWARYYSKRLALQIKAIEEGVIPYARSTEEPGDAPTL